MDGFFPFSEETTRGPTPPNPSMNGPSGRGAAAAQNGGSHNNGGGYNHNHHGAGDIAGGLKIKVKGIGGGPMAGDHGAGTPSASLVGNRAKMR